MTQLRWRRSHSDNVTVYIVEQPLGVQEPIDVCRRAIPFDVRKHGLHLGLGLGGRWIPDRWRMT